MTSLIRGAKFVSLATHVDDRGRLEVGECPDTLPFPAKRFFLIKDCPEGTVRACHANPFDQLLHVVAGAVTVDLDNGSEAVRRRLEASCDALWIKAGVWIRMSKFAGGAIILVLSPARYEDSSQFDRPQPALLGTAE